MKKWIFSLALIFVSNTYASIDHPDRDGSYQTFKRHEKNYVMVGPVENYLAVKSMETNNFFEFKLLKLESALELVEKVINSQAFKSEVINFKNTSENRAFRSNKRLSNERIYDLIMDGREVLQPHTPGEINYYLNLYYEVSDTIGWTTPRTNFININDYFFNDFGVHQIAGNLVHEYVHKLGFDHAHSKEYDSVPYAIGFIVRKLGQQYLLRGLE